MAIPMRTSYPSNEETTRRIAASVNWLSERVIGGLGTPEGNVAAGVGTLYLRFDGGAGATLYVKESGSGATGWIAK